MKFVLLNVAVVVAAAAARPVAESLDAVAGKEPVHIHEM